MRARRLNRRDCACSPVLRHSLLKRLLLLALPLMLGLSVVVMDEQFVRIFGSLAGEGAVSLLSYARRIMLVPVGVVAQAAGVASFPFLAALAARGDDARLRRHARFCSPGQPACGPSPDGLHDRRGSAHTRLHLSGRTLLPGRNRRRRAAPSASAALRTFLGRPAGYRTRLLRPAKYAHAGPS